MVAFRGLAETVHKLFKKRNEIFAEYKIRNNNYAYDAVKHDEHSFILNNFDFGSKGKNSKPVSNG